MRGEIKRGTVPQYHRALEVFEPHVTVGVTYYLFIRGTDYSKIINNMNTLKSILCVASISVLFFSCKNEKAGERW